jgi:DNA-directed RNA polymerase specialized sigma24 family protein
MIGVPIATADIRSVRFFRRPSDRVFVLREIEGLSTTETAECLETSEENVKTRLYRARGALQRELYSLVGANARPAR